MNLGYKSKLPSLLIRRGRLERHVDLFDVGPCESVACLAALLLARKHRGAQRRDVEAVDFREVLLELELALFLVLVAAELV